MIRALTFLLALFSAVPVAAQTVLDCFNYQASVLALPEPWEENMRSYANGNVRVAMLDLIEPASGAFYLLVLSPPYDEMGNRACGVIAEDGGQTGFMNLFFQEIGARYDPATGLTLRVPIERFAPATGGFDPAILAVTINQATGVFTPRFEIP